MKVLVLHNRYIHRGGEDICVDNEVKALQEAGLTVATHFIDSQPGLSTVLQALRAPWKGGTVAHVENRLRTERPDLLHVHNLYPLLSARVFAIAKGLGIRTVQTLHNYRPLCLNGLFLTPDHEVCERCPGHSFTPGILRGCYRDSRAQSVFMAGHLTKARREGWYAAVDRFIAPSQFLAYKYGSYGYPADRFTVQGHFLPSPPEGAPERPEPYLLYLGRLSEEKGIRWMIDLFSGPAQDYELRIAGDGPLKSWVIGKQNSRVRYLGYLSGEEKRKAFSKASALLMPSDCYENFPLVIMEANDRGIPVIAPKLGGFAELILPGVNGMTYVPRNANHAAEAIHKILLDKDQNLRASSQSYARKQFSKSRFQEARITLYESLLAKRL